MSEVQRIDSFEIFEASDIGEEAAIEIHPVSNGYIFKAIEIVKLRIAAEIKGIDVGKLPETDNIENLIVAEIESEDLGEMAQTIDVFQIVSTQIKEIKLGNFVETVDVSQLVLPHDDLFDVDAFELHVFEKLFDLALIGLHFFDLDELQVFVSSKSQFLLNLSLSFFLVIDSIDLNDFFEAQPFIFVLVAVDDLCFVFDRLDQTLLLPEALEFSGESSHLLSVERIESKYWPCCFYFYYLEK